MNISRLIEAHALRAPERTAIVYNGERIAYGALAERIVRLSGALAHAGILAGDVVAVLMKNSAAFLEIAFAASRAGAVFLPINFRLSAEEVAYIIANAGARILFVDGELVEAAPAGLKVIVVGSDAQGDASRLLPAPAKALLWAPRREAEDVFRLMYTSGTTDRPKGVIHTYANFYFKTADHIAELGLSAETRLLIAGPLYHVGAFDLPGVAALWTGGALVVLRDFEPTAVFSAIERERVDGAWFAPVMTTLMLAHAERTAFDVSSLRWAIGGGERTPENRIRAFKSLFPNARYIDAYGLTESCSGDTFMPAGREIEKIGSTGLPVPLVELSIRDDLGAELPSGVEGEVCLRGPKITPGYWNDAEKTKAAFSGGWFKTGDVGYRDADGFLFLTDRKKDMIISGGENIASSEVERVVLAHVAVLEVAVIGLPDPRWGERPVAVVVLEVGAAIDAEALIAHCRASLAGFKVPRQVVFAETLPRNPSGKVLKRALREQLSAQS